MMTTRQILAATLVPATLWLAQPGLAQDEASAAEDPIEAAIRAFNERNRGGGEANEVVVVLEPETSGQEKPNPQDQESKHDRGDQAHANDGVIDISEIPLATNDSSSDAVEPPEPAPKPGLEVRVKNVRSGTGELDTSKVRLLAPFPAKPLIPPPAGWRLETTKEAPPFRREVELTPGRKITLSIHPHLLVPDADGAALFAVPEPGFQASLGYQQSDTVAGVLSQSIEQLDADSKQLGNVIERLQDLLVSLPKSDEAPKAETVAPAE